MRVEPAKGYDLSVPIRGVGSDATDMQIEPTRGK